MNKRFLMMFFVLGIVSSCANVMGGLAAILQNANISNAYTIAYSVNFDTINYAVNRSVGLNIPVPWSTPIATPAKLIKSQTDLITALQTA